MPAQKPYFPPNAVRVCVDKRENGNISGRVFGTMLKAPFIFHGFVELMLGIDETFDKQGLPQAFQKKRTFKTGHEASEPTYCALPKTECEAKNVLAAFGKEGTFDVFIASRKNTSWQGRVVLPGGIPAGDFQSDVELMRLIYDKL